ncbi:MAG TPA: hypothetical protein IAB59_02255 [Candidatus Onthousia faecipullorum]|uniref:Uncharacterized protein n=1 Tax=Candidatus Onthousia faecipullorum TaxID=2840887 RepID=A0A9D1KCE9_9FIRM|nr:hypothetical protein [Candidatus Onthousia faecipullorum]
MILIPEQVKALREEIKRLEEKKNDYQEYFKECDKSTLEPGFVKFQDNTLEVDDYNTICKKLDSYKRALIENEFVDLKETDTINYGTEFTVLFDDTKEEETYILVQNTIGLIRANINSEKGYMPYDSNLGRVVMGKTVDDSFSYTFNLKGKKDAITITGKIVNIISKSNKDIHFIMSRPKAARISKKNEIIRKKAYMENDTKELNKLHEITLSQYKLLKEEQERLSYSLVKLKQYEDRIMVGSLVTLKDKRDRIKKYMIVDKDNYDIHSEINVNSVIGSKIFTKHKGDFVKENYFYRENGKGKTTTYTGEIVDIDNSLVEKEESVYASIWSIYSRLGIVNKMLRESKIIAPLSDNTIGIGSKVSILTFEDGIIQNRRVEIINQAVSTELNTDYIEAISPLGQEIIGLKDNEMFDYRYYSTVDNNTLLGNGIVYDINNNMNEELAKDPLTYQKKRRG